MMYQCLSNNMKVILLLQYHTRNRTCSGFCVHLYHTNIDHWSSYYKIMQIENHGVLELAPVRKNIVYCQFSIKWIQLVIASCIADYCVYFKLMMILEGLPEQHPAPAALQDQQPNTNWVTIIDRWLLSSQLKNPHGWEQD